MAKAKNYAEHLAKGSLLASVLFLIGTIIGYGLRIYLSRSLSTSDYGLIYAILAFVGFFTVFRELGLNSTIAIFIPKFLHKKEFWRIKSSLYFVILVQTFVSLIVILPIFMLSDEIAIIFFKTSLASLPLKLICISFMASIPFDAIRCAYQGMQDIKIFSIIEPLRLSILFIVSVILISLNVVGVAYGYAIAAIICSIVFFMLFAKRYSKIFNEKLNFSKSKEILKFGSIILSGSVFGAVLSYIDTILLTFFHTSVDVGLYQVALPTAQLIPFLVTPLSVVLLPFISELWSKKAKKVLNNTITFISKFSFVVIIPEIIIMISFPDIIIRMIFGEKFVLESAIYTLQILSIGMLFFTLVSILRLVFNGIEKPMLNTKLMSIISIANLAINLLLIPIFGIIGAATAFLISYLAGLLISLHYMKRYVKWSLQPKNIFKTVIGSIITFILIYYTKLILNIDPWFELIVSLTIGFVFYFIFIFQAGIINKHDIKILLATKIHIPKKFTNFIMKIAKD